MNPHPPATMIKLGNLMPAVLLFGIATSAPGAPINLLSDDFSGYAVGQTPLRLPPVQADNPPPPGLAGDLAEVTGAADGVTPSSPSQMLRFIGTEYYDPYTATGSTNCDLYYILDLRAYATSLANGPGTVTLSAFFNTGLGGSGEFFLGLGAYNENFDLPNDIRLINPASRLTYVDTYRSRLTTDTVESTWEDASISLLLPTGSRWLSVRLGAHGNGQFFTSSFADDVNVDLDLPRGFIPNPDPPTPSVPDSGSTLLLLGTALLPGFLLAGARKGRKAA